MLRETPELFNIEYGAIAIESLENECLVSENETLEALQSQVLP